MLFSLIALEMNILFED